MSMQIDHRQLADEMEIFFFDENIGPGLPVWLPNGVAIRGEHSGSGFGTGIWGPERNTHPFFGFAFDKIFGVGMTYHLTTNTSVDLNYLGVRQHDNTFIAPNLGSYDEIRTVFSHRFGFLFQFQESSKPGYQAR